MGDGRTHHYGFLGLISRLHDVARRHEDRPFARALESCAVDATGGHSKCPLGNLYVEDYAASGVMPHFGDDGERPGGLPFTAKEPPAYDPERLLDRLHGALQRQAHVRRDQRYFEALLSCAVARKSDPGCPIHQFVMARRARDESRPTSL